MARARSIKPGFFFNVELAQLDPLTRICFAGMWTIADREGRMKNQPTRIKAQTLPYDDIDIDKTLDDLEGAGFIIKYEVKGEKYIQINNWCKHQSPHVKEQASTIPAPGKHQTCTRQTPDLPDTCPTSRARVPEPCTLNPVTDNLNPLPLTGGAEEVPSDSRAETIKAWQSYRLEILGKGIGESPHEYDWIEDTVRWMKAITSDDPITNPYDMITDAIAEMRGRKTPPDNPVAWVKKVIAEWLEELRKEAARGAQAEAADITG